MRLPRSPLPFIGSLVCLVPGVLSAEPEPSGMPAAEQAMQSFTVAPGLQVDLWASEPLLANPVAFAFDERGRAWIAETNRRRSSAPDIRKNTDWELPNLALRTAEERGAYLKKVYGIEAKIKPTKDLPDRNGDGQFDWRDLTVESEQIRLVEDRDGDGRAETSSVFAEGFKEVGTGIAAGVLTRGATVWATITPDLWQFTVGADGKAADRKALATGFGVHVVYSGHDMHGLKFGPDGRIYWSIADAGAQLTTREGRTINVPDTGAVFRANPDGSELELVASGLRNPQSLAFNDVGDLFTGDNNADGGDKARWLHIVEGADYGWRIGWQFLPKLGAWNSERLWELDAGSTALSILPPAGHVGHGPAGIAYYPGTGLPERYREHFFYADFPGGVRSFTLQARGACYTLVDSQRVLQDNNAREMSGKLLWNLYPSDVGFSTNGGVYVLDWIQGWEKTGKGRIYRVHNPEIDASPLVQETKRLLADGFDARPEEELAMLLSHADQRVRLEAQLALAERDGGADVLLGVARAGASGGERPKLARLHAVWGLGIVARKKPATIAGLVDLLADQDAEVRAQAAKVLGDARWKAAAPALIEKLADDAARVRFFAAQALGKIAEPKAAPALLQMLRTLPPEMAADAFLRDAAAAALAECSSSETLVALHKDPALPVRAAVLLALRRQASPLISAFLSDADPLLVREAARAIHDARIIPALPQLAALQLDSAALEGVARRIVNTNYLLGSEASAQRLATIAASSPVASAIRLDALEALSSWNSEFGRDRITGLYTPVKTERLSSAASAAMQPIMEPLLKSDHASVRRAAAKTAGTLLLEESDTFLVNSALNDRDGTVQAEALGALAAIRSPNLRTVLTTSAESKDELVRKEARKLLTKHFPANLVSEAKKTLAKGTLAEKQAVFRALATAPGEEVDQLIHRWLVMLRSKPVESGLQLDILLAAAQRKAPDIEQQLATFESTRDATNPLSRWSECLEGGDPAAGREVFREKAEAACMRCHKVKGDGGDVGPDLAGIGARYTREQLLAAIVAPNAAITPGFENVMLTLTDGNFAAGLLAAEDEKTITLTQLADGTKLHVPKGKVTKRDRIPSAMPEGLGEVLGKQSLRDVVEYLSTLK